MTEFTGRELENILLGVKRIAKKASEKVMEIYALDFDVDYKSDDSPITIADKESNKVICEGLIELTPKIPIISEENKSIPYEIRKDYSYCWIIDPIDGTKEFIAKNDEFAINIALCYFNEVVLSVVVLPASKKLYHAIRGKGAFVEKEGMGQEKIVCQKFTFSAEGINIVTSRSHLSTKTQAIVNKLNNPNLVAKGSALKFIHLAEGKADYYPRLGPTMEWDTAAPQLILEEAGGSVTKYETNTTLEYNKENLLNPYFEAKGIEY